MVQLATHKKARIEIGDQRAITVVLVGCGGTGSFVALHLARLAYHARELVDLRFRLYFVDDDVVESKNIGRQNFCPCEVGHNKAQTLADRYARAFGFSITAVPDRFTFELFDTQIKKSIEYHEQAIILGCVDNTAARREIARCVSQKTGSLWWIDSGNDRYSGQVLIGNDTSRTSPLIEIVGLCSAVPAPSVQEPGIVDPASDVDVDFVADGLSCAELALLGAQGLTTNQTMADVVATYLHRLTVMHDLDVRATYVDLQTLSMRSEPIVKPKPPKRTKASLNARAYLD